jgi:N-acyl-L-homoserine lactone synthetase
MPDDFKLTLTCRDANAPLVSCIGDFRRRLFVEELGWDLKIAEDGTERDEFDTPDAVYAALFEGKHLVGAFRALRADGPYLAARAFPDLATLQPYPSDAGAWEISRFGVRPEAGHRAARALYSAMFRFAAMRQTRSLIALADLTYERFLGVLGVVTRRYGDPREVGRDREGRPIVCVAGEIPMASQRGPRFASLTRIAHHMEFVDETLVLGQPRLSA